MASKSSPLQDISQQLTCSICLDHYNTPKTVTPCLHTFCEECLQETIDSTATIQGVTGQFPCPKCRSTIEFDCAETSRKKTAAKEQFKTNFVIQSQLETIQSTMANGCKVHTGEMLMFSCATCDQLICQLCLVHEHLPQHHVFSTIKAEAECTRADFESKEQTINELVKYHQDLRSQHQSQLEQLAEIKPSAQNMTQILDSCKSMLEDYNREIKQQEEASKGTIKNIKIYEEGHERLQQILSGSDDVQLLEHKREALCLVDTLLLKYGNIEEPEPLVSLSKYGLAEICERISCYTEDTVYQEPDEIEGSNTTSMQNISTPVTTSIDDDDDGDDDGDGDHDDGNDDGEHDDDCGGAYNVDAGNLSLVKHSRQELGEKLYPKVNLALGQLFGTGTTDIPGKITGMMLELEEEQIQDMLSDSDLLSIKVEEATEVLISFFTNKIAKHRTETTLPDPDTA